MSKKPSLWVTLRLGVKYANDWPKHAVVAAFQESKVVPATRFASRWMPAIAVLNAALHWQWQGTLALAPAMMLSLFILSLPLQGYLWLGWRAAKPLPPSLRRWYQELKDKLQASGEQVPRASQGGPLYLDLARLLKQALTVLPPSEH
ncbi:terminus macrodomain insulation protein YfbV [Idiomarina xiamenensis]|uniref:UPF0208 membrane protein YfbV n=1 Tax=Idiomarina xiamenensis 10-D-4 TaxID=740709 RepID=K2KFT6_9GAMM|nr:terminus macrodomain insulation protein YfbV [Idiomarina xiamenensis]EKE86873.1 hypothetical protein A10D4_01487 [Idiomarina xiamenensis 10-D-4]